MTDEEIGAAVKSYFHHKGLPVDIALTFPDVFINDQTSRVESRSDIKDLSVELAPGFRINLPIISANMRDVTESRMAIALAREGGCGFIHQFAPINKRAREVAQVKRADNQVVSKPMTISAAATMQEAMNLMNEHGTNSLLVINGERHLVGILATRDYRFLPYFGKDPSSLTVQEVMKSEPLITARPGISTEEAVKILHENRFEKLPLVDEVGQLVGLLTSKDILKRSQYPNAARDKNGRLIVGATVGFSNTLQDAEKLVVAGADVILLDTARANSTSTARRATELRKMLPTEIPLMVGNVDNAGGARLLADAGVNIIKVGIGPGSACKTRIETGIGVPQVTAIAECAAIAERYELTLIADGGIHLGREFAIAISAGAHAVMMGGALAGTDESPGEVFVDNGQRFKKYRGSASLDFQEQRVSEGTLQAIRSPEGESRRVPYKGDLHTVLGSWLEDLRSAMSYANTLTIQELRQCKLRRQSLAGYEEGKPKV